MYVVDPPGYALQADVGGRSIGDRAATRYGQTIAELIEWASEVPGAEEMAIQEVVPDYPRRQNATLWKRCPSGEWFKRS